MKILVYATSLGADLLSMVRFLEARQNVEIKILVNNPELIMKEPMLRIWPLKSELISRTFLRSFIGVRGFKPDITIMDNHLPYRKTSPKALILWHGFGWKGPNDVEEFKWLHKQIKSNWGDAMQPNPHFVWQCFGPWDFEHRTQVSGFHPDNCRVLGAASHDELIHPFDKSLAAEYYPFDIQSRKNVLIAPTWHYGEVFSHWGGDRKVLTNMIQQLGEKDANIILRLHDSFRFEKSYVKWLKSLEKEHPNLLLKFKDVYPDNYLDIKVSDLLITNFSSIANLFYATGKPAIHVYPVTSADEAFLWRKQTLIGQRMKEIPSARYIWKLPPEENGGWMAKNEKELLDMTNIALNDETCCANESRSFLDKHMLGADGKNRERIWKVMQEMF
ncbi:CDP-glycerol glycerophosphotransferase family protein [Balneolaceae bacterium ANBcel3]|nr:CDP-glycerol glycerophosphotransferase family protein [Balneolaceae bacterium ANBcel3]